MKPNVYIKLKPASQRPVLHWPLAGGKEVYFTAWPFSKLQVLHWPVVRAA
jgi:hypothetical protein